MGKKNDVTKQHTNREFMAYTEKNGGQRLRQSGSHVTFRLPNGTLLGFTDHPGEPSPGLRVKIIKTLLAAGITVTAIAFLLPLFRVA